MPAPLGFGQHPWGIAPAGYGTPGFELAVPPRVYLDTAGNQHDARAISPDSGDLIVDDSGQARGQPSVEVMVYLALMTSKGSAADPQLGRDPWPVTKTPATPAQIRSIVTAALDSLVRRQLVAIDKIEVNDRGQSGVRVVVNWTDLTRGTRGTRVSTEIPVIIPRG